MSSSFRSRLLSLCRFIYGVAPGPCAIPNGAPADLLGIGLVGSSQAIGRNPSFTGMYRDLAFVGRVPEGIVIAIRGTQPPRITSNLANALSIGSDWLNDGIILGRQSAEFGGIVHDGFANAAISLSQDQPGDAGFISQAKALAHADSTISRIILTGHSKGGPAAQLAAFLLKKEPELADIEIEVVTFAAARPGDAAFKAIFDAAGISSCVRYETYYDIVPRLPLGEPPDADLTAILSAFGFTIPAATLGFVALGDAVVETQADADAWDNAPETAIFNVVNQFTGHELENVVRAITAHSISPGSHYDHLVAHTP